MTKKRSGTNCLLPLVTILAICIKIIKDVIKLFNKLIKNCVYSIILLLDNMKCSKDSNKKTKCCKIVNNYTINNTDCNTTAVPTTSIDPNMNFFEIELTETYRTVLNKTHGIYLINIYKENSPYCTVNLAKSSASDIANINYLLKSKDITVRWDTVIEIKISGSSNIGTYQISWI